MSGFSAWFCRKNNCELLPIEELAFERGLTVDHSTINRWVIHFSLQWEDTFRRRHKRLTGMRFPNTYMQLSST